MKRFALLFSRKWRINFSYISMLFRQSPASAGIPVTQAPKKPPDAETPHQGLLENHEPAERGAPDMKGSAVTLAKNSDTFTTFRYS